MTILSTFRVLMLHEPLLLHGWETWTLTIAERNQLMTTDMWFLRRMLENRWVDEVTNEEIVRRAGTQRWIIQTIAKRQGSFFGHVIRKEILEHHVTTGKSRGRQPRTFTD